MLKNLRTKNHKKSLFLFLTVKKQSHSTERNKKIFKKQLYLLFSILIKEIKTKFFYSRHIEKH